LCGAGHCESGGQGGTQVVQSESFRGLLVPLSGKMLTRAEAS
jgi:hypothetical protein